MLAKQGKYIAAFAPFGYQKSEDDKHMLVPDPVTAPVVQLIIEINMNEKWWVFATEKVLASSELMIDPVAVVSIHNVFTGENANITENEDIRTISNILCGDAWNTEGTTDCLSNIEITINEETYKYHSDCGTFNDNVNQNYLSLDDERKAVVNAIFSEYISLTATEVPAE